MNAPMFEEDSTQSSPFDDKKSRQIEEIIISILLHSPEMVLVEHLESRWFFIHRRIIETMLSMSAAGLTIDVFTLSEKLGDNDSWLAPVAEIMQNVFGSKHNYSRYVSNLRELFEGRVIFEAIKKAQQDICSQEKPSEVLSGLISESMRLVNYGGKKFNYTSKESMRVFVEKLEEVFDTRDSGGTGLKTGIQALDDTLGGMQPSDLTVIGARPAVGKTAFAVSILRNIAKSGRRVVFFSTEMSVFQVMGRFVSIEANINASKLRSADLNETDYSRLTAATAIISNLSLRICDKPAITVGELAMQARAWAADGGVDFIAIDYLTRIRIDKPSGNQNLDVGVIVTELKNLARTLNIPVMVLAQLNRQSTSRKDKRPAMSDLRDSGIIEQEADQIVMLYRFNDEEGVGSELIVEKNRHGECGIVRCDFEPTTMHWRDLYGHYGHAA